MTTVRHLAARVQPGAVPDNRSSPTNQPQQAQKETFAEALRRASQPQESGVKLSAHAQQRIEQRGISMKPDEMQSMSEALGELEAKGSQDALLLRQDAAFVVNVPNRTVVTALGSDEMQHRTFTQIDSAMLL